jgi:hypothetical protein
MNRSVLFASRPFRLWVLNDDHLSGDPAGLAQQDHWVCSVVQHIDEQHGIERLVPERNGRSIERLHGDVCVGSYQCVDPDDLDIGSFRLQRHRDLTIACADIEDSRAVRRQLR